MAVTFDSSASKHQVIAGGATSGSATASHNVNPDADNVVAIVGMMLLSGVALNSGPTFGATFGGEAMSVLGTPQYWDSNKSTMRWFQKDGPLTGARDAVASVSNLGTESPSRYLFMVSGTWANVDSVGTPVEATVTSTTDNTVDVTSVAPAHAVVSLHAVGKTRAFRTFDNTRRADIAGSFWYGGGELLLGETPGTDTVSPTATMANYLWGPPQATDLWAAAGVSLAPAIIDIGAALSVGVGEIAAGAGIYRTASPSPERTWVIHGLRPDSKGL